MPWRGPGSQGCAGRADGKKILYKGGDNEDLREIKFGERESSAFWG